MHYMWVMRIRYKMSASEIFVISAVSYKAAHMDEYSIRGILELVPMMFAVGTGGGTGAIVAMFLHHKYVGEHPQEKINAD